MMLSPWHCISQERSMASNTYYTADSLTSGSVKNVFTSFFQLALDNLTGSNRQFNFSSNPYAVMLQGNPDLALDYNYGKYKYLRRLNFNFGISLDSNWQVGGFSTGLRFSLIDQRDSTSSKRLWDQVRDDSLAIERNRLAKSLSKYMIDNLAAGSEMRIIFENQKRAFLDSTLSYNQLDTAFRRIVDKIIIEEKLNAIKELAQNHGELSLKNLIDANYRLFVDKLPTALLWTVGITDTTYKNQMFFSNVVAFTQINKGITANTGSNLAFDAKAGVNFTDDTALSGNDLNHIFTTVDAGLQWVFRAKGLRPLFDVTLKGQYTHIFSGISQVAKKDNITMNMVINIRVLNDIWVPLTLNYDPNTGSTVSTLNVKLNFDALGNLFR